MRATKIKPEEVRPDEDPAFEPSRTALGARLRAIRAEFIASGGRLLSDEELEREVAQRRGGVAARDE